MSEPARTVQKAKLDIADTTAQTPLIPRAGRHAYCCLVANHHHLLVERPANLSTARSLRRYQTSEYGDGGLQRFRIQAAK